MKKAIIERLWTAAFAVLCAFGLGSTGLGDAITKKNPVTDETETYTYKYVGTTGTWTADDWVASDGSTKPNAAPNTPSSNVWDPILIDGADLTIKAISVSSLEGWNLQLGVFGGASVTASSLKYWNGSPCFAAVDALSSLTISATDNTKNWNASVNLYVASANGISFSVWVRH